jgi:cobaltochelatase CobS
MKTLTWKNVDEVVEMKKDGNDFSLHNLEVAIASDDSIAIKEIVTALRGPSGYYEASVYPFGGIVITVDMQVKRVKKWQKDGQLINHMYDQAVLKAKKKGDEDRKIAAAEEARKAKEKEEEEKREKMREALSKSSEGKTVVEEVDDEEVKPKVTKKRSRSIKKAIKPTINIKEQIKFEHTICPEGYGAYVPAVDDNYEYPTFTLEYTKLFDRGMNAWLYGGTGSGKSSLVEQTCAVGNLPLVYVGLHEDTKPDQLFGGFKLVDGNTIWQDGPVTKAYRDGLVLLLDELDAGLPEILFSLFAILDRKPLVLTDNGCEVVNPHPNFRIVATGNTLGRGDETGMYNGTNIMNRALLNRFRIWYHVEYPSEKVYKKIIMSEGVNEESAKAIARLAKEINTGYTDGTLTETFSLRDAREVGRVAELVGSVRRALQLSILARVSTVEAAAINEIYRRIMPDDVE